ncbi:MAG: hypothetical protein AMDU2_EPLC00005G0397 [Thermoplasmatales archaeon E-plasma]|nr:MAG: hypothetical protein AMDU2_EPLC00005G0397 [Thermoplasmatales archaeon E-plasma]
MENPGMGLLKLNANRYRTSKTVRVTALDSPFIFELQEAAMAHK